MPKRTSQDIEGAIDGPTYNKLQRPDNWSAQTPRKSVFDLDKVKEDGSDDSASMEESVVYVQDNKDRNGGKEEGVEDEDMDDEPSGGHYRKKLWKKRPNMSNGQWGCLPMDDGSGSENEISFEALEYLRAVRYEADGLPQLVATSSRVDYEEEGDSRGFFEDGAYLAAPEHGPVIPDDYDEDYYYDEDVEDGACKERPDPIVRVSACEAYTTSLLSRFRALRESLHILSSTPKTTQNGEQLHLKVPYGRDLRGEERRKWESLLYDTRPTPSQVASADIESLMSLVHIIKHQCMLRGKPLSKNLGSWIFAILARLDERTMDSQMAYNLRDLAKKAIWLSIAFEPRFAEASEAMGREAGYLGHDEEATETQDGEALKDTFDPIIAAPESNPHPDTTAHDSQDQSIVEHDGILSDVLLDDAIADDTTKAALDMIVTIIGEVYGQRDLLDSRTVVDWPQVEIEDDSADDAVDTIYVDEDAQLAQADPPP